MERYYSYKISPEVIKSDLFFGTYQAGVIVPPIVEDPCCVVTSITPSTIVTGYTSRILPMSQIVTGGTNGNSLMTGLTLPILLTQNNVDIGYYSVFDGTIQQKDFFTNFIFSGSNINQYEIYLANTSEKNSYSYLNFSNYILDWGDGTTQTVNDINPLIYSHIYPTTPSAYTITMSGISPWNINIVQKTINLPFSGATIPNPNGIAFFTPLGGSWSGTPISYDYLFSGDSICDTEAQASYNFTTVPFLITGYTNSRLNDLRVYGKESELLGGKYKPYEEVNGSSGVVGYVSGYGENFVSYVISGVTYIDFFDGDITSVIPLFTIFFVESSGITSNSIVCSALTKNEVLLNVISETEIQSNVYVERGKISPLESLMRLGEVDNFGDLQKYGYKFFNILKST
jgi:hypothetical protein